MNEMLSAYRAGAEMGHGFHDIDAAMHNRAVQGKMDEILKATAERGGDITMIDPSLYSDRVGLEAMGKVAGQMANTEAWKLKAMQNNAEQARHRFATFQQYFTDIEGAIKDGDQSRTVALMSNMASQSGTPYRFMPTEDGQIRVGFITPEGEVDKGTMSMTEAYDLLKPYATNQDRFIQDSVMYSMATQAENAEILQDPRRWKQATDGNGNQYTLIPQRIYKNGQLVSGFLVSGPGGQRNMTMEEVSRAGLLGGQGLPASGGGLPKGVDKVLEGYSTVVDPVSGEKSRDAHMYEALSTLTMLGGGNPNQAVIALRDTILPWVQSELFDANGEPKKEAVDVAEQWGSMTPGQQAYLAVQMFLEAQKRFMAGGQSGGKKQEKNTEPSNSSPEKAQRDARMKKALAGEGRYGLNLVTVDEEDEQ